VSGWTTPLLTKSVAVALVLIGTFATPGASQEAADRAEVLAVVNATLDAISREDMAAVAGLMIDGAVTVARTASGENNGMQTMTVDDWRAMSPEADFVERGFDAQVQIDGPIAAVWLPYDFYIDGKLSHCGIDAFTLVEIEDEWRIASVAFTRMQPPDCRLHPDGPPEQ